MNWDIKVRYSQLSSIEEFSIFTAVSWEKESHFGLTGLQKSCWRVRMGSWVTDGLGSDAGGSLSNIFRGRKWTLNFNKTGDKITVPKFVSFCMLKPFKLLYIQLSVYEDLWSDEEGPCLLHGKGLECNEESRSSDKTPQSGQDFSQEQSMKMCDQLVKMLYLKLLLYQIF